jgi:two-component system sensor histidine kinase KdpD
LTRERPRPSPDALLAQATRAGRGRLKILLGAAPGVGKTYEMLSEGAQRKRAGVDVVIGVVETHGRADTAALTEGLEVLPRRAVEYGGRTLYEMDLDGLLARRPRLALVDELAHTNAPGSRHPKRHQDVEELLAAGIDVFTTVNIQHVESLNDVVASFTHVRVRETVPDRVLEDAEIEVVDIPPDELIERLREGKVYLPEEATRALSHFFSRPNLSALRELALRRAAQAVDARMLEDVRAAGAGGVWGAGERIVVAVSELPGADGLVRATKRIADAAHAPWTAVHIDTPRGQSFGPAEHKRLASVLNLATQLGGAVASVPAEHVVDGLKAFAADARATQIVVGKSSRSRWFELRHGSVVDRLVRETPGVAVHVMPLDGAAPPPSPSTARGKVRRRGHPSDYAWTALMVASLTAAASGLSRLLDIGNVALLYLLPVMAAATLFGLRAGLFAGVTSSLAYNYFFIPPTGTFTITDPENAISVMVLLGVAVAISQLASRVRAQADLAAASARSNAALAGFLRRLTAVDDADALAAIVCEELGRTFDARAVVVRPTATGIELAGGPADLRLETMERAAAEWTIAHGRPTGRGTDTLTASEWRFHPLIAGGRTVAALGMVRDDGEDPLRSDQLPLFVGLLDQASLAVERVRLTEEMQGMETIRERDRLRAALLRSVGHDLRTPLTAIVAAAAELERGHDPAQVATVRAEAERLRRFVANLLDMARVEAGALKLRVEATDLTDAVASAVHDTRGALAGRAIRLEVPPNLPLVRIDPQLLHHCLLNLLDNAGRYGEPGTPVIVRGERTADGVTLSVADQGPGLPVGREASVWETFHRLEGSDRSAGGTGLGLAIVKGFAEAMGLGVDAANREDGTGALFSLRFPAALLMRAEMEVEAR